MILNAQPASATITIRGHTQNDLSCTRSA